MPKLIKNLNKFFLFFLVLSSFNGCALMQSDSQQSDICKKEPVWAVTPPVSKDKIYGVGIAGENINGESAQRHAAISRAVNEIAMQLRVKVKNGFYNEQNSNGYNYADFVTFQTVDNQVVNAKIIKSCKNPESGMLYILMEAPKR